MSRNDRWWVSLNDHAISEQEKSLNQKILHARYITANVARELSVEADLANRPFPAMVITVMKGTLRKVSPGAYVMENVKELAKDVIG